MTRMFTAEDHTSGNFNIPAGEYMVFIMDDEETGGVARKEGPNADYYLLSCKILNGPNKGARLWHNLSLSEKAWFRIAELYMAVEPEKDRRRTFDLDDEKDFHQEMFYKPFKATVKLEVYDGKERPKIQSFVPISVQEEYDEAYTTMEEMVNDGKAGGGPRGDADSDFDAPA